MSTLSIKDLTASVADKEILRGIDLELKSGEVHAVMGPNGSGKSTLSHVLMGKPGYLDVTGSITLDGREMIDEPTFERAKQGMFLAMQYPTEVAGVSLTDVLRESITARGGRKDDVETLIRDEARRIGFDESFLGRALNVDMSGGEKKRNETLMLGVLKPRFAILDEIDSGLDIDALRIVARRVEAATTEMDLGVLAITHYNRLLDELKPDRIHILVHGQIVDSGGPELAEELEVSGYVKYGVSDEPDVSIAPSARVERPDIIDPWGGNPLGDK